MDTHDLTKDVWRIDAAEFPADGSIEKRARFLLRYAILAPSSHNSQPWAFTVDGGSIEIHAAEDRWLDAADPDKRELYVSLGCAIENLCIAAAHFDLGYEIEYHDDATPISVVTLRPDAKPPSDRSFGLFGAITERTTNHLPFEATAVSDALLEQLRACVIEDDVSVRLVADPELNESIAALQAEADQRQLADSAYRRELGYWIGTGALGDSWLKARIGQAVVSHLNVGSREAQKNSKLVRSAPIVAVLTTDSDAPTVRVETGRSFQRLALAASAEGVAVHPMSQILERPAMRAELATLLDADDALPQHLFRLGYAAEEAGHTPRWPLEKFLVERT
ncbi:nitroreductase family protein [Halovivax ruber XH-70]|uniref:Nitroreductase family protein n=1 Tax=Halovivax ruber (strain DSM 18193 / JCM 13892 / XH-70) TaxID=797302 RepID=L0IFM7_HALRX|nr:nitroreductase family protein [Halovivax ruber]AGB17026.1 nitroreductase family protein [Halovivax ruber XH-70]